MSAVICETTALDCVLTDSTDSCAAWTCRAAARFTTLFEGSHARVQHGEGSHHLRELNVRYKRRNLRNLNADRTQIEAQHAVADPGIELKGAGGAHRFDFDFGHALGLRGELQFRLPGGQQGEANRFLQAQL